MAWNVADLVDHVVGGNRWAAIVLGGVAGPEALDRVRGSSFGADRPREYASSAIAQSGAFRAEGALGQTVDHLAGEISGAQFLRMRITDLTVHARDLARAIGAGEELPGELVRSGLDYFESPAARAGWIRRLVWRGSELRGTGRHGLGTAPAPERPPALTARSAR